MKQKKSPLKKKTTKTVSMLSGEFNYQRRSTINHSSNFVYDDEIDDENDNRGNDYLDPATIEDNTITGLRAVQDDSSSKYKQVLLPYGVIEDTKGENEFSDDGGAFRRRKTMIEQQELDKLTFRESSDKKSDKDTFNSSLGGWGHDDIVQRKKKPRPKLQQKTKSGVSWSPYPKPPQYN